MLSMTEAVVVIPARGGSKRLPRKNLLPLGGIPLLEYSIRFALTECPEAGPPIVSTEDGEIAACAYSLGCEVIERPDELSADTTPTGQVVRHALTWLREHDRSPRFTITLQPTCPLRPRGLLASAWQAFGQRLGEVDSLVSVSPTPQKTGRIIEGNFTPLYQPGSRSQDLANVFAENGLLYITDAERLEKTADLFGSPIHPFVMDELYLLTDIDTAEDLQRVEKLLNAWPSLFGYLAETM